MEPEFEVTNKKKKVKKTFIIDEEMYVSMKENLEAADTTSMNKYVNKALRFYNGYLRTTKAETYLLSTFSSVIRGTIQSSEDRIIQMLFKVAVEVAMQNRIIAYDKKLSEKALGQIRDVAIDEVRKIK